MILWIINLELWFYLFLKPNVIWTYFVCDMTWLVLRKEAIWWGKTLPILSHWIFYNVINMVMTNYNSWLLKKEDWQVDRSILVT